MRQGLRSPGDAVDLGSGRPLTGTHRTLTRPDPPTVRIARAAHTAVLDHAARDHSRECLGLLAAEPSGTVVEAVPLASGGRAAVSIPRADIGRAETALQARGLALAGTYHSHPGRAALPSEADRLSMRPGELLAIVALPSLEVRAYVLDDERRHAVPILLELVPDPACGRPPGR